MSDIAKFWDSKPDQFGVGDLVVCDWIDPIAGNTICPNLEFNKGYTVEKIHIDKAGHQHLDVGLKLGEVNFVRSHYTGDIIPSPLDEHWCHPTRFHHAKIKKDAF